MIARAAQPAAFARWNGATGAPFRGPFALYPGNCATRIWEYPWAFHAVPLEPGMKALDLGGGLSGFAIVLARAGLEVTVLDPNRSGREPGLLIERFAEQHGASVKHVQAEPGDERTQLQGFERVYCLSVLEHLPTAAARAQLVRCAWDALRPGGHFVVTVDLSLRLRPFTDVPRQPGLVNVALPELLEAAPFSLTQGVEEELYGLDAFSTAAIQARAESGEFLLANGHILSQCLVLTKPEADRGSVT